MSKISLIYFKKDSDYCGIADTYTGLRKTITDPEYDIWPNPGTVMVNIEIPAAESDIEISFYNLTGQCALSKKLRRDTRQIDISNLTSGVYFVHLKGTVKDIVYRFVKM